MRHVDALSRNLAVEKSICLVTMAEDDWLLAAQQSDKNIHNIRTILETGDRSEHSEIFNEYALKGGKVYKITARGLRGVIPKTIKFQLLRLHNDDIGHLGFEKNVRTNKAHLLV